MKIHKLTQILDQRFPLELQEKYDNAGEQICFGDKDLKGVMLSLDLDNNIINEAYKQDANLIITHHPFLFKPIKSIKTGEPVSDMLLNLIEKEISLYSAHTNLDKVYFDKLGEVLGIDNGELLFKTDSSEVDNNTEYGFGILGQLDGEFLLADILKTVKEKLDLEFVIYSGEKDKKIKRLAILGGSGGSQVERIIKERNVDCIITGDIGYHACKTALDYNVSIIDAGHFGTEKILLNFLKNEVEDCLTKIEKSNGLKVYISKIEKNPFKVFYQGSND